MTEDDETNQALKLLGHSIGIIALGKKIVLVEGETSSLDKEVYGSLARGRYPELVLVPSGGKHVIESFETVRAAVLDKSIWGVEFFMLCDRDSVPAGSPRDATAARFRILQRYHLENYFLNEVVLAEAFAAFEPSGSWLRDPAAVRSQLRDLAASLVSYAVALEVAARVRLEAGNVSVMPKDCHGLSLSEVTDLLVNRAAIEQTRLANVLDASHIEELAAAHFATLEESLRLDDHRWLELVPGKPLLARFAGVAGLQPSRLKTLYLRAEANSDEEPFADILSIFQHFAAL